MVWLWYHAGIRVSVLVVWQAVVDVPPSLQRVVEFLLRVVELLHHVVDIVQSMQTFYNAL